jgi:GTP-binding protein
MHIKQADFLVSNTDLQYLPKPTKPEYAFIGRSNVGKSSLINSLCNNKNLAKTSGTPGKTQLINHFTINKDEWYLVDLPGYGFTKTPLQLKRRWENFTRNYLRTRENLMCVFLLIDSRHKPLTVDIEFMEWLGGNRIPFVLAFTKIDKLDPREIDLKIEEYNNELLKTWDFLPKQFKTSASAKTGNEEIMSFVNETNKLFSPDF